MDPVEPVAKAVVKSIVANLIVESIEACLPFYVDRLGFTKTIDVLHEDKLGFVSLARDGVELMLQSRASLAADVAGLEPERFRAALYVEVDQLAPIRAALRGWPEVIPERTTFYGAREIIVRDPAGNVVVLASREPA
ncbi:MAG TPA: VOC family protein [Kofleriaceae bacterium]|nr:VOC family protein [Kofleriaceae bacterium]